jgi:release factor glutamine methyltransferase
MTVAEALSACAIPASEARTLLASASGLSRVALAAHPEALLSEAALAAFESTAARRASGEPMAYLLGEREFYGVRLGVTPDVLIPRPETELLVDFALEALPSGGTALDLGTGSGAIAVAVKLHRPDVEVTAVERSAAALAVARANAEAHRLKIELVAGSWFCPLGNRRFDVIVTNPPYVAPGDPHLARGDVRFEPREALVSEGEGLEAIAAIARAAPGHLRIGGWVAIEHGQGQEGAVRELLLQAGLDQVSSRPDLAGIARISIGKYNPE